VRRCYTCDRPGSPALLCAECKRRWAPAAPVLIPRPAGTPKPIFTDTEPVAPRCNRFGYPYQCEKTEGHTGNCRVVT
jgi:hypothetical protein